MSTNAGRNRRPALAPIAALGLIIIAVCAVAQFYMNRNPAPQPAETHVVINEIMTKNAHTIEDDFSYNLPAEVYFGGKKC